MNKREALYAKDCPKCAIYKNALNNKCKNCSVNKRANERAEDAICMTQNRVAPFLEAANEIRRLHAHLQNTDFVGKVPKYVLKQLDHVCFLLSDIFRTE